MSRLTKFCLNCSSEFTVPVCRDWREHCCSSDCKKQHRERKRDERKESRKRNCLECSSVFYPRQYQIEIGQGKFCSMKCSVVSMVKIAHQPEANENRTLSWRKSLEAGKFFIKTGPENKKWKGGLKEYQRRRVESGEAKIALREYRKNNPHKTREWYQNRRARMRGRLPKGTVAKMFASQKERCAYCQNLLGNGYHVDHIIPLSRGGRHVVDNIQLLCKTCNLRKSAKDPKVFEMEMKQNGVLK